MFMHHPKNWELVYLKHDDDKRKKDKPILVPIFSTLRLEPGINNVKLMGRSIQPNIAVSNAQERGFTVLSPEKHDYMRVYPALNGTYHTDKWTEFEQYGTSLLTTFNKEDYNLFRKNLVKDGFINPPHKHFMNILIHNNAKLINKYAQQVHNPNHKKAYEKAVKKDADLKECMKKIMDLGISYYE